MTRWFTADTHFGHANIIRYCGRPFADVVEMDRALVERWNEVVSPSDEVWVLGDVAMGQLARTLPIVAELAGRKVLVPGNHDRCWPGHGSSPEQLDTQRTRYLDAGFAEILDPVVTVDIGGQDVLACHFPYEGDSHDEDRFDAHRPRDHGGVLLHGHVHTRWKVDGRQVNVGCDVWDYRPVPEHELAGVIGELDVRRRGPGRRAR